STFVRHKPQGAQIATVPLGLTHPDGDNPLWVSLDAQASKVEVGRGSPGEDVILSLRDPAFPPSLDHVAFGSHAAPVHIRGTRVRSPGGFSVSAAEVVAVGLSLLGVSVAAYRLRARAGARTPWLHEGRVAAPALGLLFALGVLAGAVLFAMGHGPLGGGVVA